MRIVFFGSAHFALPTLELLNKNKELEIAQVITKPDKPAGRGMQLIPTPVKTRALKLGLSVSEKIPTKTELLELQIEKIVVIAYGLFIPAEIFENWHCINLHPSLLPKYRGPSPLQSTLLNGDKKTGITTMLISQKMDAGDILIQKEIPIDINLTIEELHDICASEGSKLVLETLQADIEKIRKPQDESRAVLCKKIAKDDRRITPGENPLAIHNKVRAITGFVELDNGKRVKILKTTYQAKGEIGQSHLLLDVVQPEGKSPMAYSEYLKGHATIDL